MISLEVPLIIFTMVTLCLGRIGFVKDQSIANIEFPPRILRSFDSGIPIGHLRPLGWQRTADGRVKEEVKLLRPQEFYDQYVAKAKPVVFRNYTLDVPAISTWQRDDYLKKEYGEVDVAVVMKKEQAGSAGQKMKFKKFLKDYHYEDWYLSSIVPQEMMHELVLPQCLRCGLRRYLSEAHMWMSSGGTTSLLHSHADHNLHCVLSGRKDFILIDPKHKHKLQYVDMPVHTGAGYSELDTDRISMFHHAKVAEVPWTWSTLWAGDCLYIPARHLHQVRSHGRSFSSTCLWAPAPDVNFSDCQHEHVHTKAALSDVDFIWMYNKADKELTNLKLNSASLRHHLQVWMRDEDDLRYEVFDDYYNEIMSEMETYPMAVDVWSRLDPEGKGSLDREAVDSLSDEILATTAAVLNQAHQLHKHHVQHGRDEL